MPGALGTSVFVLMPKSWWVANEEHKNNCRGQTVRVVSGRLKSELRLKPCQGIHKDFLS